MQGDTVGSRIGGSPHKKVLGSDKVSGFFSLHVLCHFPSHLANWNSVRDLLLILHIRFHVLFPQLIRMLRTVAGEIITTVTGRV